MALEAHVQYLCYAAPDALAAAGVDVDRVPAAAGSESEGKFIYRSSTSKASAKAAQPSLPVVPRLNVAGLSVHIVKAAV